MIIPEHPVERFIEFALKKTILVIQDHAGKSNAQKRAIEDKLFHQLEPWFRDLIFRARVEGALGERIRCREVVEKVLAENQGYIRRSERKTCEYILELLGTSEVKGSYEVGKQVINDTEAK